MVNGSADIEETQKPELEDNNLEQGQNGMAQWDVQLDTQGNEQVLVKAIMSGIAVAVSNGSFQDQAGAVVWTIESQTKANRILGQGCMPGTPKDQSTYQSKLFGLWGILTTVQQIVRQHHITEGKVLIACNSLTALHQAQSSYPVDPNLAHYDLIRAI